MSFLTGIKNKYDQYKDDKQQQAAEEKARQDKIAHGEIEPVNSQFQLSNGERAFAVIPAKRFATVAKTTQVTKRKGVLGRAVVGGLLLGPLGALGGAATAGSQTNSTAKDASQQIDKGELTITNKRFIFAGKEIASIAYDTVLKAELKHFLTYNFTIQYEGMLKGEYYQLSGDKAKDAQLYYQGSQKTN